MAKKKPVKKPVKAKAVKPAKKVKKTTAPAKSAVLKAKKVKGVKPVKEKAKRALVKGKPEKAPQIKDLKGKKGKKPGDVVEVVIAPSNPVLRDLRKSGSAKSGSAKGGAVKESTASAGGKKRCRETACDQDGLIAGYCRLHYIKNWRRIKRKEAILASGQLNNYVEELVKKYPDKYLDVIRQDLASEKEWAKVVVDLELESSDDETAAEDEIDPVADGVRRDRDFDEEDGGF